MIKNVCYCKALIYHVNYFKKAVPVLCGSSYKNIGIEPLMDAIILYLPSPMEMNEHFKCFDENVCAKAFKVLHDKKRGGALTFLRLYSGTLTKSQRLYNIQKNSTEQIGKLLVPFADDFQEVNELSNGNVGVVTGLKVIHMKLLGFSVVSVRVVANTVG